MFDQFMNVADGVTTVAQLGSATVVVFMILSALIKAAAKRIR